ncbi:MAG TPA: PEP/pyruvate-binding domain-containing protein, partial [Pseudonocardiaceae bacterium]
MSRFVLWLDNAGDTEDLPARIGPKLARLAELRSAGLTVPEGFAVTADAHRLAGKSASMPEEVRSEVVAAYEELAVRCLRMNPPTAVRSSAVGEDSADASFAGAFESYLGVRGPDRVITAIQHCWASMFTPRATAHLLRHGRDHRDMPMAVGVLELVAARSSGVGFSAHPVT